MWALYTFKLYVEIVIEYEWLSLHFFMAHSVMSPLNYDRYIQADMPGVINARDNNLKYTYNNC